MTLDPKAFDLAKHFLSNTPFASRATIRRLAKALQTTAEHFISDLEERSA